MKATKLRVVIFQEGEWLCARFLEYDLATQAKSLDGLTHDLQRLLVGHIAIAKKHGLKPFQNLRPAPRKYWEMFRRSKIALPPGTFWFKSSKGGLRMPPPEIRIAPLAA
jgi:hypothetical protein